MSYQDNTKERTENDDLPLKPLDISKNLSIKDWSVIAWAMTWRSVITMTGSFIVAFIVGYVIGFAVDLFCSITNYPFENLRVPFLIFSVLVGVGVGFIFLIILLKWFFATKYSKFEVIIREKSNY